MSYPHSCFSVTHSCGHSVEKLAITAFPDEAGSAAAESLGRYMRERREKASETPCPACLAAEQLAFAVAVEKRMGLPRLTGCGGNLAWARSLRARTCAAVEEMDLDERDSAAVAGVLDATRSASAWSSGAYRNPDRLVALARSRYMTVGECSEALGVSGQRVRKMLSDGILEGLRTGSGWLVSVASAKERKRELRRSGPSAKEGAGTSGPRGKGGRYDR